MNVRERPLFRFGAFVLVPTERLLLHSGKAVTLTGRAFDLLVVLVRNAGHLVSKEQLLQEVWRGLVVEEVNLSVNMSALRKALADEPGIGWIETVPKRGYRFNGSVEVGDVGTADLAHMRGLPAGYHVPFAAGTNEGPVAAVASATANPLSAPLPAPGLASSSRAARTPRMFWAAVPALVLVLLLIAVWGALLWQERNATPLTSVAVLPFSADQADNEFVAEGLSEAIINSLAKVHALRVTPRASAYRYKPGAVDPQQAGRSLGAVAAVTGALTRRDGKLRIQVDLIDVRSGAQVWGASYSGGEGEMVVLQSRIAQDLTRALKVPVTSDETRALSTRATENQGAYQAYLLGRYFWNQRSESGLRRAIAEFRKAADADPRFALAYAGLADAYTALGYLGFDPPLETFPVARPLALKALELDPTLADAHASLAYIKFYFDWDWSGADEEFRQALALGPDNPVSHQWYAIYLLAAGKADAAFREVQTAQQLDPLSLAINTDVGLHHHYNGRYPEAIKQLQTVLGMESNFVLAHLWLGRTYLQVGRFDDALREFSGIEGKIREWPVLVTARGFAYGMAGRSSEANGVLEEMRALAPTRFVTAYGMALIYAGLKEKDQAFQWLDKAFAERSHWLVWLRLDPRWNNLRDDPRFPALVERMKYPA